MLSNTPYINSSLSGAREGGMGSAATVRGADLTQHTNTRAGQEGGFSEPLFPAGGDKLTLSPAARQLAKTSTGPGMVNTIGSESSASADTPGEVEGEDAQDGTSTPPSSAPGVEDPPPEELQQVQELKLRDQEVRTHEAAHAAVGGQYAGAPTLEYETGPDGKRYAVAGKVNIDLSKVKDSPQETIAKMEQIQAAALAPAQPSAQDRRVAARAAQIAAQARMDLRIEQSEAAPAQTATSPASATPAPQSTAEENAHQPARVSTPAVSIESLRWAGAVA